MQIAIGTPTHECKEYGIYKWLDSIKAIDYPISNIFISDNSNTEDFAGRMIQYCDKIGLDADISWVPGMYEKEDEYRRMMSREVFRQKILATDVDWWLSWECDILVVPNALREIEKYIGDFDSVSANYPSRDPNEDCAMVGGIGFSLVHRRFLEKYSFLDGGGYGQCNPNFPNCYYSGDSWFMQRVVFKAKSRHLDFFNLFPIEHLAQ